MATKYEQVCQDLGIRPESNFVAIKRGGAISWTAGKPDEVRRLYRLATAKGYKISAELRRAAQGGQ